MTETRPAITLEFVRVQITELQSAPITAEAVQLAFMTGGTKPAEGDWHEAQWLDQPRWMRTAAVLVGPGGALQLAAGVYTVWYRFQDTPERPARPVDGTLIII